MIKAVLFDYGGVLSPGGRTLLGVFGKLLGIPPEEVEIGALHHALRRGDISTEDFFAELGQQHGKTLSVNKFIEYSDIFVKNQKVYDLAERLRKNNIQVGILSNMYQFSADILQRDGYYEGFSPVVLSCVEHLSKPDKEFYEIAIQRLGVQANEILFIDDQDKCFPPAQKLGMHTIKADNEDQIVADIKALFKKENNLVL